MVTSGAVALGRQRVGNEIMLKTMIQSEGKVKPEIKKVNKKIDKLYLY